LYCWDANSRDFIGASVEPLQLLFFHYLWQNDVGFAQGPDEAGLFESYLRSQIFLP
jgi:hypothetical protein